MLRILSKRVLLIAYYFPPLGMSGVQRVAKFAKYLPEHGWDVSVLTVHPRSYYARDETLLGELDRPGISIHRTASVDPTRLPVRRLVGMPAESRHRRFSLISQSLFQPDNKIGWYPFAVRRGKELLDEFEHHAILSSAPPYTAHLIGAKLSSVSGLPLVVDYRDDWLQNPRHVYPTDWHRRIAKKQEDRVFQQAVQTTSINERIRDRLVNRSRGLIEDTRHACLPHGFDPEDFEKATSRQDGEKMNLVYTGVFYDAQRPDVFLQGLARFLAVSPRSRTRIAASFYGLLSSKAMKLVHALRLEDVVQYKGYVAHGEAVSALKTADVLWMTVGEASGSAGISTGKLYEYFGSRKPILGLVPQGVARESLVSYDAAEIVAPDDPDGVAVAIGKFFSKWESGSLPEPNESFISTFDRRLLAKKLSEILNNASN